MGYSEFNLIEKINSLFPSYSDLVGIGDDVASIPTKYFDANLFNHIHFSVDTLVESIHFDLNFFSFCEIGKRALAVNLSDLAASGATPIAFLVALSLPEYINEKDVIDIYLGMKELSDRYNMKLIGGNISKSAQLQISINIIGGSVNKPILRSGAQVGDYIYISGKLGRSFKGLAILQSENKPITETELDYIKSYLEPTPRIELSQFLVKNNYATSMIDISDGFIQDATHIAKSSNVSFNINENELIKNLATISANNKIEDLNWNDLTFGDDYELLFTSPSNTIEYNGISLNPIGIVEVKSEKEIYLTRETKEVIPLINLAPKGVNKYGYQHLC